MPTTYAHYRFGKDVLEALPGPLQKSIESRRELFDIGLHGPDILFYYRVLFRNHVNQTGYQLHDLPADTFFKRAERGIEKSTDKAGARAYIYGVICHFAPDSECHNYVEKMIQVSGISHSEIEMEFDRLLLTEDGIEPVSYLGTGRIHPTRENAEIIAPFYKGISVAEIKKTLAYMILCLKVLHAPDMRKRRLLTGILKLAGQKEKSDMIMSLSPNPDCKEYTKILKRQYEGAKSLAVKLILNYQGVLLRDEKLSERFGKTFGAGDDWESLEV